MASTKELSGTFETRIEPSKHCLHSYTSLFTLKTLRRESYSLHFLDDFALLGVLYQLCKHGVNESGKKEEVKD